MELKDVIHLLREKGDERGTPCITLVVLRNCKARKNLHNIFYD